MGANENTIWLAPLHGITYYYFRNVLFQHCAGIDRVIAPFVPAQSHDKLNVKKWVDLYPANNPYLPIIPQLMGNEADAIVDTIKALQKTYQFQDVNWNIGCPMNPIVRKKRGCGIMPHLTMIEEVVNKVNTETSVNFSIKMRLGMWNKEEGLDIIQMLNEYRIDRVIIHPRLGIQQYKGTVDLDGFTQIVARTRHQVVYSGDIVDYEGFLSLQAQFPQIKEWMIGRGALRDPFLIQEIKQHQKIPGDLKMALFCTYYHDLKESLFSLKGAQAALPKLKELWKYLATFFQLSDNQLKMVLTTQDILDFEKVTEPFFSMKK